MQTTDFRYQRKRLIETVRGRGITDEVVLQAMIDVPREEFVSDELREFAYRDAPLPIGSGQTISQPFIVGLMTAAAELAPDDRVLEIGTGCGYAAAVLSRIVKEVYTVERIEDLARSAGARLKRLGFHNVHVRHADGTLGWPEQAPFDAIIVTAGGPQVPPPLLQQLRIGGRLVIPVGDERTEQELIRVVRRGSDDFERTNLGGVLFVPLIGQAGWHDDKARVPKSVPSQNQNSRAGIRPGHSNALRDVAEPFESIETANLKPLLDRIGDAQVVLIGEASHGTSEFYRMRARITKALIEQKNFDFVAVEADWPDAYRIHDFVTHKDRPEPHAWEAFARFPTWMWRNEEVLDFIHWLRDFNRNRRAVRRPVGFYGLDLYSMFTSIHRVLHYLKGVDPQAAAVARERYGCLAPWQQDPATYGRAALNGSYRSCERDVVQMLRDLVARQVHAAVNDGEDLFDAQLNARLVADAERYYRVMYYGSDESWNHRDRHMFQTLQLLRRHHGDKSKAVIWEHNSHLGNAAATQFGRRGQINVGQLCREEFGEDVYSIGQGTDHGTVAAATDWEGEMEIKSVRPSLPESYEQLMHLTELNQFFLPLTKSRDQTLTSRLAVPRLERAIGVIYRPETERQSHYFEVSLTKQFDEWIWFDESSAVHPLGTQKLADYEPWHPFAAIDR
ncbi:MAG: protein-L-isoaspartate(D-aspartate) O-methyltransferase [Planctomycetes bacterium]|nr:protein-L-isoaspartate(D-aspartate) O-methyltransferase [Planctomycetota bacterium]